MDFALMTEPQLGGTYDEILAAARWAEDHELAGFARSDHYYAQRDPKPDATDAFATLAGLARDTTRVRLGVLVTPITFRHPSVIAKTAATIDQMSGGRLDVGIGTGWMDLEHEAFGIPFPEWGERFARLEEALAYVRAAFGEGHAAFGGDRYTLEADVRPTPSGVRIIVGGTGPTRTPTLAGTHADEYNHIVAPGEDIAPKVAVMRDAAASAGRDPSAVVVSVMGPVLVGRDEDEYRARLVERAAERDIEPSDLEERLAGAGVPFGHGNRLAETLGRLAEAGVEKYYIQWIPLNRLDGLEAMVEAMRGAASAL